MTMMINRVVGRAKPPGASLPKDQFVLGVLVADWSATWRAGWLPLSKWSRGVAVHLWGLWGSPGDPWESKYIRKGTTWDFIKIEIGSGSDLDW